MKIVIKFLATFGLIVMASLILVACSSSGSDVSPGKAAVAVGDSDFQLVAPFSEKRPKVRIAEKYTCHGENLSPPLTWSGAPNGTKSFALLADEPESELGPWLHWSLYNIPIATTNLSEGIPTSTDMLPDGTKQGTNDFNGVGYDGPCPSPLVLMYKPASQGDYVPPHKYFFTLYALNTVLELETRATRAELEKAMEGHILAQAETAGKYTTPLGLSTKEGKGFMEKTGGREAYLTVTPVKQSGAGGSW